VARHRQIRREPAQEEIGGEIYPVITTEVPIPRSKRRAICTFIFRPGRQPALRELVIVTDDLLADDGGIRSDDLRAGIIENARLAADEQIYEFLAANPDWAWVVPSTPVQRAKGRPPAFDDKLLRLAQAWVIANKLRPGSDESRAHETERYSVYKYLSEQPEWVGYSAQYLRKLKSRAGRFLDGGNLSVAAVESLRELGELDPRAIPDAGSPNH
jgi:hypothetical protein